jgi:RNA polymerase sigma-70 factor (ECF subfamily)
MTRSPDEKHAEEDGDSGNSQEAGASADPETVMLLGRGPRERGKLLADLFMGHRDRLKRMAALRLDCRLRPRLDPSDVLQEAYLEASRRLDEYLRDPKVPLFIWLRFLVRQRIQELHRFHLGARLRDARREVVLDRGTLPEASSAYMAQQLLATGTSPLDRAAAAEKLARLEAALNSMAPLDREVLALRHFELLTSAEAAKVLSLRPASVRSRYLRALKRLNELLSRNAGPRDEEESR